MSILRDDPARVHSGPIGLRTQDAPDPPPVPAILPQETPRAPDEREVAGWLAVLIDPGQVAELRAPKAAGPDPGRTTNVVQFFDAAHLPEMASEALRISGRAPAVYFTLNPVRPELMGGRKSAADADIVSRRRFLIDCDPKRDPDALDAARRQAKERGRDFEGLSATDAEKLAAMETAATIRDHLSSRGWPDPVEADSGNGAHLVYAIDLPNDAVSRDLVKAMLATLAARFNSPAVDVDTSVFNASRIVKLYGTAARKGGATAERPHRTSRVLKVPDVFTPVPRELLETLAAEAPSSATAATPAAGPPTPLRIRDASDHATPTTGTTIPHHERLDRGRKLLDVCEPAVSGEGGHNRLFKVACNLGPGLDLAPEDAFALLRDVYNPRCLPPWSEPELRHKVEEAYKRESRRGWLLDAPRTRASIRPPVGGDGASTPTPPRNGDGTAPPLNGHGDVHQVANADFPVNEAPDDPHRLARAVLADFAHRDGPTLAWYRESFFAWDGTCYRDDPDLTNRIVALVKAEVDRQNRAALQAFHEQAEQQVLAPSLGRPSKPPVAPKVTRRLVADVLQALASLTSITGLDAEAPFWIKARPGDPPPAAIVAAANGLVVLDADGGPALGPHTPRFFSTFALPYRYDPGAPGPSAWLKFLGELWPDDPASVRELQKWFGYALTPDVSHQKILLLIGSPGSGRSTIKDVLSGVVGRRNVASTSAVALADRFGLEPIMGKTLAILGDARAGDSHDTAVMMDRLLRISGGDPVEVNRKGRPILHDVQLHARLVIVSNEMPNFRDSSKAIVRRYLPLCTPRSFEGREDRTLIRRLLQELSGLLNWAIAGRAMLAEDGGFITPASADDLIVEAKALASPVSEFIAEECILGPDQDVTVEDIWKRWKEWAERNGHQASHKHLFGRNLRSATGFKIHQSRPQIDDARVRIYTGIGVRTSMPF
jgi:putative DNA primase/helicase